MTECKKTPLTLVFFFKFLDRNFPWFKIMTVLCCSKQFSFELQINDKFLDENQRLTFVQGYCSALVTFFGLNEHNAFGLVLFDGS